MPGLFDRIKDTTSLSGLLTVGTSFVVDNNPAPIYQTFRNRYSINDANISVAITSQTSSSWMVCWCTYTNVDTLRVDEIIFTSNTSTPDAPVTFSGASDVFVTASSRAVAGLREANTFTSGNYFTSANAGVIGIGNTSPHHKIDITGGGFAFTDSGGASGRAIHWGDRDTGLFPILLYGIATAADTQLSVRIAPFGSTGSEKLRINSSGDVGIGTTSPGYRLHVAGTGYFTDTVRFGASAHGNIGSDATQMFVRGNNIAFQNAASSTTYAYINSSGNVGIGTASPASKLVVSTVPYSANQDAAYLVAGTTSYTGATTNWGTYGFAHKLKSTAGGVARVALDAITGGGLTEIFCADTSGNFGIGTPTPSRKLTVSAGGTDARINVIDSDTAESTATSLIEFFGNNARGGYAGINAGSLVLLSEAALANGISLSTNGAERVRITNTGRVGIGTPSPGEFLSVATGASEFAVEWSGPGKAWVLGSASGRAYIRNKTDSVEAISILNDGKVGIGTTGPASPLVVNTGSANFDAYLGVSGTVSIGNGASSGVVSPSVIGTSTERAGLRLVGRTADVNTDGDIVFDVRPTTGGDFATVTTRAYKFSRFGTDLMTILRNGNVGIGTTNPSTQLHVVSASNFQPQIISEHVAGAGTGAAYFMLDRARGTVSAKTAVVSGDTLGTLMARGHDGSAIQNSAWIELNVDGTVSAGNVPGSISFLTTPVGGAASSRMRISASGYVGIGTSSPSALLTIDDNATVGTGLVLTGGGSGGNLASFIRDVGSTGAVKINASAGNPQVVFDGQFNTYTIGTIGNDFRISDDPVLGNNDRLTILLNGNVGIGTTGPGQILHIERNQAAETSLFVTNTNGSGYVAVRLGPSDRGTNSDALVYASTGSMGLRSGNRPLTLETGSGTERMRIFPSGAISFHNTFDPGILSVNIGAGLLRVYRQNTAGEGGQIEIARSADNGAGWYIDVIGTSTTSSNELRFVDAHNAAVRLNITERGVAGIVNDLGPASADTLALGFRGSPNNDLTGNYTLALTDAGRTIRKTDNTARTVTVPADATVNFPLGTCIMLCNTQPSAGLLTITPAAGVSLIRYTTTKQASGTRTVNFGGSATLRKVAANYWSITGTGVG